MAVDVIMPQMGESIFEGTITRWLKKPGDRVERDEPLFEISTDKVDAEIPAPSAGVLKEIKVTEGQTVPIQTVVAVIDARRRSGCRPCRGSGAPLQRPEKPSYACNAAAAPPAPAAPAPAPRSRASGPGRARQWPENPQLAPGPQNRQGTQPRSRRDGRERRGRAHQQERYSRRGRIRRREASGSGRRACAFRRPRPRRPPHRPPRAAPSCIRHSKMPCRANGFISATTKRSR